MVPSGRGGGVVPSGRGGGKPPSVAGSPFFGPLGLVWNLEHHIK